MKILVLSHISELLGGAERSMLDVLDEWNSKNKIEVEFILREPIKSLAGEITNRGWKYHPVQFTFWSVSTPLSSPEDILRDAAINSRAIRFIQEIIEQSKPDVVITNTLVSPWAAFAAHYQQVPHVWFVREYGDLDHGRTFDIGQQRTFEDIGNLSNLVVTNSQTLASHIEKYAPKEKVTYLYNPFNIDAMKKRSAEKVHSPYLIEDSLKLIMTSNIARTKGHLELTRAVGELISDGHNIELCLLGRGDTDVVKEIEDIVKKYGAENRIHLTGLVPNALAYVSLADIGIIASRKEAFGRATFECMALGKPIIGANSGATPELVDDGKSGYLFEYGDVKGLKLAIQKYLKNPNNIKAHGVQAQSKAAKMLLGENNADAVYGKVKEIVAGKGMDKAIPINFTGRWLDCIDAADKYMRQSSDVSLKKIIKSRARQKARNAYWKGRSVKGRLTGK